MSAGMCILQYRLLFLRPVCTCFRMVTIAVQQLGTTGSHAGLAGDHLLDVVQAFMQIIDSMAAIVFDQPWHTTAPDASSMHDDEG